MRHGEDDVQLFGALTAAASARLGLATLAEDTRVRGVKRAAEITLYSLAWHAFDGELVPVAVKTIIYIEKRSQPS